MKLNISDLLRTLMWFQAFCLAGCAGIGVINTPSPVVTSLGTSTPPSVTTPTLLPFNGTIAFIGEGKSWDDNHIYIINANDSGITDITPPDLSSIGNLSWSPDGQYIAFDAMKDGISQMFTVNADGSDLVQLTFGGENSYRPSWSPDGENIIFGSSSQDILDPSGIPVQQIYIMKSDGSEVRQFIVETKPDNTPMSGRYRTDGLIAVSEPVTRYASANYIVNSDGVIQKQVPVFLTTSPVAWSPDGKWVIYSPSRDTSDCLGLMLRKFDGSNTLCLKIAEAITNQKSDQMIGADTASWSPDGKYIIFSSNLAGDSNIYVIKPDDTGLTQITNLPGNEGGAVWSAKP
jgi:TolB protein